MSFQDHFDIIRDIVENVTRHNSFEESVESANKHALLQKLRRHNAHCGVVFVFLRVVGSLSESELLSIINSTRGDGALRLLIFANKQIVFAVSALVRCLSRQPFSSFYRS